MEIPVKRALVLAWAILCGLAILTVLVLTPFQPWTWHTLELSGKAIGSCVFLMTPSVRYIRRTQADRDKLREIRDIDRRLDEIDGKQ